MVLSKRNLSLLGVSLYICEGTRMRIDNRGQKQYALEFTNKDPRTILVFLRFLREIIKIEEKRLKAQLFIYPDHNPTHLINFWSKLTDIPISRFNKIINLKQKNQKFKPNLLGTLKLRYHHKPHFLLVSKLIDKVFGVEKEFVL